MVSENTRDASTLQRHKALTALERIHYDELLDQAFSSSIVMCHLGPPALEENTAVSCLHLEIFQKFRSDSRYVTTAFAVVRSCTAICDYRRPHYARRFPDNGFRPKPTKSMHLNWLSYTEPTSVFPLLQPSLGEHPRYFSLERPYQTPSRAYREIKLCVWLVTTRDVGDGWRRPRSEPWDGACVRCGDILPRNFPWTWS